MSRATTDWTFGGAWPYAPKWFDTPDGRMHYIDEGPRDGIPVVMVHGNPTWGYLYRRFIKAVTAQEYRAIVMDHLGFGRSDKPTCTSVYSIPFQPTPTGARRSCSRAISTTRRLSCRIGADRLG